MKGSEYSDSQTKMPMRFHAFVRFFALPLGLLASIGNIALSVSTYYALGWVQAVDLSVSITQSLLIVICFIGFFHLTLTSWKCLLSLYALNLVYALYTLILYAVFNPTEISTALSRFVAYLIVAIPICIYYIKRRPLFGRYDSSMPSTDPPAQNAPQSDAAVQREQAVATAQTDANRGVPTAAETSTDQAAHEPTRPSTPRRYDSRLQKQNRWLRIGLAISLSACVGLAIWVGVQVQKTHEAQSYVEETSDGYSQALLESQRLRAEKEKLQADKTALREESDVYFADAKYYFNRHAEIQDAFVFYHNNVCIVKRGENTRHRHGCAVFNDDDRIRIFTMDESDDRNYKNCELCWDASVYSVPFNLDDYRRMRDLYKD